MEDFLELTFLHISVSLLKFMSYSFYLHLFGLRSTAKTCRINKTKTKKQLNGRNTKLQLCKVKLREIIRSLKWGVVYLVATYGLLGGISVALTMVKINTGLVVLQALNFIAKKTRFT